MQTDLPLMVYLTKKYWEQDFGPQGLKFVILTMDVLGYVAGVLQTNIVSFILAGKASCFRQNIYHIEC